MVTLQRIVLTNFMSIEHLDMSFDNSMIMIGGQNGGGKSSLLYALAFVLYEHRKGDSYRDYIKAGSTESTVLLEATYNGYPIIYDYKLTDVKYGTPLSRTIEYQGNIYTNSECSTLLKQLDSSYLEHAMFLMQNDISIVDMRPAERAKLLKKVLHLEFDEQVETLKNRIEDEKHSKSAATILLGEYEKKKFYKEKLLDDSDVPNLPSLEKELAKTVKELNKIGSFDENKINEVDSKLKAATQSLNNHNLALSSSKQSLDNEERNLEALKNRIFQRSPIVKEEKLEEKKNLLQEEKKNLQDLQTEKRLLTERISSLTNQVEISKTGVCHSCGNTITKNHVDKLLAELEQEKSSLDKITKNIASAATLINNTSNDILELEKKAFLVEKIKREREQTASDIKSIESSIKLLKDTIKAQESAVSNSETIVKDLEAQAKSLAASKKQIEKKQELSNKKEELEKRISLIKEIMVVNAERQRHNEAIEKEKEELEEKKKSLIRQINNSENVVDVLKKSISIFETEFPNYIILKTCAKLEGYINNFIQKLFPYMAVKLQPKQSGVDFYYTSASSESEWLSVKMASGAQSAVLTLAWRVAIARLYGMNTILLDEVDASATEENAALIYQFIASLDTFDQIIFVSHKTDAMKSMMTLIDDIAVYYVQDGEYTTVESLS